MTFNDFEKLIVQINHIYISKFIAAFAMNTLVDRELGCK